MTVPSADEPSPRSLAPGAPPDSAVASVPEPVPESLPESGMVSDYACDADLFPAEPVYPQPPHRPATIDRAVWLWLLAAGCWALGFLIGQLLRSSDAFTAYYGGPARVHAVPDTSTIPNDPSSLGALSGAAPVVFVVVLGTWLGLVWLLRLGVNWARLVLAGFGAVTCVALFARLVLALRWSGLGGTLQAGFAIVVMFAVSFAIALMFQAPTTAYVRAVRAHRRA